MNSGHEKVNLENNCICGKKFWFLRKNEDMSENFFGYFEKNFDMSSKILGIFGKNYDMSGKFLHIFGKILMSRKFFVCLETFW